MLPAHSAPRRAARAPADRAYKAPASFFCFLRGRSFLPPAFLSPPASASLLRSDLLQLQRALALSPVACGVLDEFAQLDLTAVYQRYQTEVLAEIIADLDAVKPVVG